MRYRLVTFIVLGLILVAYGEWSLRSGKGGPLPGLSATWLEFCIGNAGDRLAAPAVTMVRITDEYEPVVIGGDEPPEDGELSRLDYATMLALLSDLDPKAIAFLPVPVFDESLTLNQPAISPLRDAALKLPRFRAAAIVSDDGDQARESAPLDYPAIAVEGDPAGILAFTRTVVRPDEQILANADAAFRTIESARHLYADGALRVPLVARYRDEVVPSVVLAAVADHAGVPLEEVVLDLTGKRPVIRIGEFRTVPVGADGAMGLPAHAGIRHNMKGWEVDEEGGREEVNLFASLTVDELAYTGEREDEVAARILESIRGKFDSVARNLVVFGFDRISDRRHTTARGELLSETAVLARAAAVIQSGRFIEWWPGWGRALAFVAIGLIAAALFRLPRGRFIPLWLVAVLIFFTAWVLVFRATLTWTPPFTAFALFALMLAVALSQPVAGDKIAAGDSGEGEGGRK